MLGAWYQATAPHLIQSAFISSGMEPYWNGDIFWKVNLNNTTKLRNDLNEIALDNIHRIRIT